MLSVASHSVRADEDGTPVCPHCLCPLPVPCHFCASCATPVTAYASTAPLEYIWALGTGINRLISRKPNRVALLGTFLIALSSIAHLALLFTLHWIWYGTGWQPFPALLVELAGSIPTLLIDFLFILLFARVVRLHVLPERYCHDCGYDLTGNRSGKCPECGHSEAAEGSEPHPVASDLGSPPERKPER